VNDELVLDKGRLLKRGCRGGYILRKLFPFFGKKDPDTQAVSLGKHQLVFSKHPPDPGRKANPPLVIQGTQIHHRLIPEFSNFF
jgi:hypothetical protein